MHFARQLAATLAIVLTTAMAGCGPMPGNLDPHSALDDEEVGRPVMALRWKKALADTARERKPQEFASAEVVLGPSRDRDTLYVGSTAACSTRSPPTAGARSGARSSARSAPSRSPTAAPVRRHRRGFVYCLDTFTGDKLWHYLTKVQCSKRR